MVPTPRSRPGRDIRRRRLGLEHLEDRRLLAGNLSIVSLSLVNGIGQAITNPAIGEQVFLRARWDATNTVSGESYNVRIAVDGVNVVSGVLGTPTGSQAGITTTLTGWYAAPGNHSATVTLDVNSGVVETNEADNALTVSFAPTSQSPPQKISLPLVGSLSQYDFVNYVDVDPGSGTITDFRGGKATYDGHNAYDIGVTNFSQMDQTVPIVAAANGTVIAVHDGEFDRQTAMGSQSPNYVTIDHGSGWRTTYLHLRRDSVAVTVGQSVTRGDLLGFMGSSGSSSGPHVHFNLSHNGSVIETYYQPADYWVSAPAYVFDSPYLMQAGVTNYNPGSDFGEGPATIQTLDQSSGQIIYAYGYYAGVKLNDSLSFEWIRPDGSTLGTSTFSATQSYSYSYWYTSRNLGTTPAAGSWQVRHLLNGVLLGTQSFTVTAAGAPEIRVRDASNLLIPSGRYTPIDFGPVAQGATAPTRTFTVSNHGSAALSISAVSVPAGFTITKALATSIAAGAQDTLTIARSTSTAGYAAGLVRIATNDADESLFTFSVEGLVTSSSALELGLARRVASEGTSLVGNVSRTGSVAADLTVTLAPSVSGQISVPMSVLIPAGATSAIFTLSINSDTATEGRQTYTLQASAAGFSPATNAIDVLDSATGANPWHHASKPADVDGNNILDIDDVLAIITALRIQGGTISVPATGTAPPYLDVDNNLVVNINDAIAGISALRIQRASGGEGEAADYATPTWDIALFAVTDDLSRKRR